MSIIIAKWYRKVTANAMNLWHTHHKMVKIFSEWHASGDGEGISKVDGDDRGHTNKAVLLCLLRIVASCWNIIACCWQFSFISHTQLIQSCHLIANVQCACVCARYTKNTVRYTKSKSILNVFGISTLYTSLMLRVLGEMRTARAPKRAFGGCIWLGTAKFQIWLYFQSNN